MNSKFVSCENSVLMMLEYWRRFNTEQKPTFAVHCVMGDGDKL